jgi:hypothetical protein
MQVAEKLDMKRNESAKKKAGKTAGPTSSN